MLCSKPERSKLLVLIASLEVDEDVHNTSMSVGHPPKEGALKINVDRALVRQNDSVSIGGLLQNSNGAWLNGFSI